MRLLLFSDLHLDTPFTWAGPDLARARRQGLRDTLTRIAALADEVGADALCCAGDLYEHERFTPDTGAFLRATFADAGRPVLIAPGNHDWYGPASLYAQTDWSPNVTVFNDDRLSPIELTNGFTVFGAAHRAPANTDDFLESFMTGRSDVCIALFHGSERGGLPQQEGDKIPHAPFDAERIPQTGLAHALVGHFHTPHDGQWHTYPGNPDPLSFGEHGPRAAVSVEIDDNGQVSRTRHAVASTHCIDVELHIDGARHLGDVRRAVAHALGECEGVVRLTLTGDVSPSLDLRQDVDLRDLGRHLQGLVVRMADVRPAYDLDELRGESTVRGQFVRDVLEAELDDDTRRKVITTGLRALDGRSDELEVV